MIMASSEERVMILRMIEQGKISAEEGARLIASLGATQRPHPAADTRAGGERRLRVIVTDTGTGRPRVNIQLPLRLADTVLRLGARFVPRDRMADYEDVVDAVRTGATGQVVDILDAEDGHRVEVFVE
jgi:hypothetical protein